MKKLLVLLLISALAIFVFAGCEGLVPSEGEGEGEGEGEVEAVTVDIDGMQTLGGKNWISGGSHDITVTFPTPMTNVSANITGCTGDYRISGSSVVLFPNEDKTVWTGSGTFGKGDTPCCASYVQITSGECSPDVCIEIPVIVDEELPYAKIEVGIDDDACECGGCAVTFESTDTGTCETVECCGDDCSGLAGWSIAIYEDDPFKTCCNIPCEEPVDTCSGTACPIECTTICLDGSGEGEDYYVLVDLVDNVGNEVRYYAILKITGTGEDGNCAVSVEDFCANVSASTGEFGCDCTDWSENASIDTDDYIGFCQSDDNCCVK